MGKSSRSDSATPWKTPLRIAAIYTIAAGLWYFLTDMLLLHFYGTSLEISPLVTVKRCLFVLASACLIQWLVRRNTTVLRRQEQKATAQLDFLQTLIDTIPSPIFYKDREGRYVGCNLAFENFLGKTKQELVGKSVYDLAPKDLADKYFEMDEALFTNPGVQVYESSVVYADGTRHDVIFNKATFANANGETGGLVGVILDVTERKQAEEALAAAENKFRSLVEQSFVGAYINQDGKFVYANPKMADIFGYTQEELTSGISHLDLTAEKDRPLAAENVRKRVTGETPSIQYEFQGLRKNRSTVEVEVYGTGIMYGGRPAVIGTLLDVTARKRAEEELKDSEERFHQIYTQNWDAVILFRLDNFAIIDANPAAMNLYRLSHEEIINVFPASLIGPNDFRKLIDLIPKNDRSLSFQLDRAIAIRGDGTKMIVSLRAKVLRLRDEYIVYCSARDISERVRMEEEIKSNQAKLIHTNKMTSLGMLASSIAHEVNNPNSYINVNSSMLADVWRDASPILHNYYEKSGDFSLGGLPFSEMESLAPRLIAGITEGSRQINDIVKNMRDFVKSGKGSLDGKVDVNRVIRDATSILWHHIHRHTDNFRLSLQEDIPSAKGNSRQIEQAVINLIMNALQALLDKSAAVFAESSFDPLKGRIKLIVRDEGKGMEMEVREKLKEPFFTTRMEEGGTGLGLYISDTIIKEHGGSLEIESAPGKGTTATISLLAINRNALQSSAPRSS
ncbi:MAG: PAS domain S-box protein [Geobacter sp.]|nr:PAS domain S-box protein [Geobacter sp.]